MILYGLISLGYALKHIEYFFITDIINVYCVFLAMAIRLICLLLQGPGRRCLRRMRNALRAYRGELEVPAPAPAADGEQEEDLPPHLAAMVLRLSGLHESLASRRNKWKII
jgi:hypothetical protein